jgi:hypothetical protein
MLEDLKYKKYKAMIDEISRPRQVVSALSDDIDLAVGDLAINGVGDLAINGVGDLTVNGVGDLDKALSDDTVSEDLSHYFTSKIAEE